jgi:hypothetical protein
MTACNARISPALSPSRRLGEFRGFRCGLRGFRTTRKVALTGTFDTTIEWYDFFHLRTARRSSSRMLSRFGPRRVNLAEAPGHPCPAGMVTMRLCIGDARRVGSAPVQVWCRPTESPKNSLTGLGSPPALDRPASIE